MKYKLIHRMCQVWENTWIHLLILSFLVLGACSNDNVLPTPDPIPPTDTAYISLAIDFKSHLMTKGYDGETISGESEEDYVKKVRLVLYDGESSISKVVKAFDFQIETNKSSGQTVWTDNSTDKKDLANTVDQKDRSHFITYARKVPLMDYKMLVIVNPTGYLESITKENDTYGLLETAYKVESGIKKTLNVGGLAESEYFLMTSGPELINVPESALSASVREAHNYPVSATVARVVGKVTIAPPKGQSSIPVNNGAEIGDVQWELDITNRYTFWMKTFSSAGRKNEYGIDPNYSGFGAKTPAERAEQFFYVSSLGVQMPEFAYGLNDSEYCLENTMDLDDQKDKNVITRALLRYTYKPANVETLGDGFYVFNGTAYSFREMKDFADKAEKTPAGSRPAFCDAIIDAQSSGYTFHGGEPLHNNILVEEPFEVEGITYYHKGINYYAVKILHLGDKDTTTPGEGHYGVLRNTHYTIHIDKINGPGSPGILWDDIITRSGEDNTNRLYNNIETSITIR